MFPELKKTARYDLVPPELQKEVDAVLAQPINIDAEEPLANAGTTSENAARSLATIDPVSRLNNSAETDAPQQAKGTPRPRNEPPLFHPPSSASPEPIERPKATRAGAKPKARIDGNAAGEEVVEPLRSKEGRLLVFPKVRVLMPDAREKALTTL